MKACNSYHTFSVVLVVVVVVVVTSPPGSACMEGRCPEEMRNSYKFK